MKVSGFTIVKNALLYNYPIVEAIKSILPICDEFIVNIGISNDGTDKLIASIKDPKIKVVYTLWDQSKGVEVLSEQTNFTLGLCQGDWAFYLQADEVIHENDLPKLKRMMQKYLRDDNVEALRFEWLHFFGSFYRYRDDNGWYQKQDRIVKNNRQIRSIEDAYTFQHISGRGLKSKKTGCFLYHYGWVLPEDVMQKRLVNHKDMGFKLQDNGSSAYNFGNLKRFPIYFGSHPKVMQERIQEHKLTQEDQGVVNSRYWWHPFRILNVGYKRHRGLIRREFQKNGR
ncbi:MAG: hypothetical protein A2Z88_00190 [Omnitrophica WOR_2 bacterium GWA2_47_8]|nr:MAG: hypothetical protein A2Z88_00190 [Omnitrophica WOR_2 bacterium GWA2_47_8]